jgi:glycosyltransferase involved in cell wall biosynthesis
LIKVAFWYDRPIAYTGGLNYIRNLLFAISLVNRGRIEPYLFLGSAVSCEEARGFAELAIIVRTRVLDRGSLCWFLDRLFVKGVGSQILVKRELHKHGIRIVSHAAHVAGLGPAFRVIAWFPDFQFLHLPEFFPGLDVKKEVLRLRRLIEQADASILSSYAALEDFRSIAPKNCVSRARVLQFVSQPRVNLAAVDEEEAKQLIAGKYGVEGRYFYLPNQFWIHKNHWVVFKAVAQLKARGIEILVVCTGNLQDYRMRNTEYVDALSNFIVTHSLGDNIRILGLVPYEDVLLLMRGCSAVINPSRFEGWSSTVEEAKSLGKRVALSNIAVHREQAPSDALYFDPDDVSVLGSILEKWWHSSPPPNLEFGSRQNPSLRERTVAFGERYIDLVERVQAGRANS